MLPVYSVTYLPGCTEEGRTCFGNLFDMPMVGATTTAHHVQVPQSALEMSVLQSELTRVADIKVGRLIQFGMTHARGIRTKAANSLDEWFPFSEHVLEVSRMGAVDHVVAGIPRRRPVDLFYRSLQRLTGWKPPIGLDRE
jgi:hypothetical protein